jgi:hypothetical protein
MIAPVAQAAGTIPSLDFAYLREWIAACGGRQVAPRWGALRL